ncbi:MAG: hypothetical protein RIR47_719 [Bacteroidota bacterium]
MKPKAVTIFCGSKSGNDPSFELEAKAIGALLAEKEIEMV